MDLGNPRSFTPVDATLRVAMQRSAIALHPRINLWQAWLGFNLSHSLGLLMFGGAFLYVGIRHSSLFSQSVLLQGCAILILGRLSGHVVTVLVLEAGDRLGSRHGVLCSGGCVVACLNVAEGRDCRESHVHRPGISGC